MAALFHIYAHGPSGQVNEQSLLRAASIVSWHLFQARAFLGDVSAPRHVSNARRLDAWLMDRCRILGVRELDRREAQNRGPIRNGGELDAALAEARRARLVERDLSSVAVRRLAWSR